MPEQPDFNQIARELVPPDRVELVVDALRLVWNARGATDLAKLEGLYDGASPKLLDRALRSLDPVSPRRTFVGPGVNLREGFDGS